MEELIHADIFFFVTTIVVVVVGLLVAIGLFYIVRIVRDVQLLVRALRQEGEKIQNDITAFRSYLRREKEFWKMRVSEFKEGFGSAKYSDEKDE